MSSTTPGNVVSGPGAVADRLPHDPEAERAVLGAVLLDPGAMLHIIEKLQVDHFYLESHRIVYQACLDLHEKGDAADLVTVRNHLTEQGRLEQHAQGHRAAAVLVEVPRVLGHVVLRNDAPAWADLGRRVELRDAREEMIRRAGESGANLVVVPGIDTIDVSAVDTSLLGHTYYGDSDTVLTDMAELLRDRKPPDLRNRLHAMTLGALKYWKFLAEKLGLRRGGPEL